jgi:uncharacterized protein YaiI (UPF0178 family)
MTTRILEHDEYNYTVALEGSRFNDDQVCYVCTADEFALSETALLDHLLRQGVIINNPTGRLYAEDVIYDVHQRSTDNGTLGGYAGEAYIKDHTWHAVNSNVELKGLVEVITPPLD